VLKEDGNVKCAMISVLVTFKLMPRAVLIPLVFLSFLFLVFFGPLC
jgi:hypothetical protein